MKRGGGRGLNWALAGAVAVAAAAGARAELVDKVAAVVNNEVIALSEVEQRAAPELARLANENDPEGRLKVREKVLRTALDQLIGEKLLDQQIKEMNLDVTDQELEAGIEDVKKNNNLDSAQFEQVLRNEGYTMSSYRDFMRRHLAKLKLVNMKVRSKVKISDEDLKAEYARYSRQESEDPEVHARHLLIHLPVDAKPAEVEKAQARAMELAKQARSGADFAQLAKKYSQGPSASDGGDLGYFRRGVMMPEFEKTAFALKPGEVSDPIRTKFGWHVIKVEDRRASPAKPFEEVKDQLRERLTRTQLEKYTDRYVQELRQNALVEVKI